MKTDIFSTAIWKKLQEFWLVEIPNSLELALFIGLHSISTQSRPIFSSKPALNPNQTRLWSLQTQSLLSLRPEAWKIHNFAINKILHDVNFAHYRSAKSAILTHLQALNVQFHEFLHFLKAAIYQINKIHKP